MKKEYRNIKKLDDNYYEAELWIDEKFSMMACMTKADHQKILLLKKLEEILVDKKDFEEIKKELIELLSLEYREGYDNGYEDSVAEGERFSETQIRGN